MSVQRINYPCKSRKAQTPEEFDADILAAAQVLADNGVPVTIHAIANAIKRSDRRVKWRIVYFKEQGIWTH